MSSFGPRRSISCATMPGAGGVQHLARRLGRTRAIEDAHAGGPYFAAFFAEASGYAEGPTWLMRGNVVADGPADLRS